MSKRKRDFMRLKKVAVFILGLTITMTVLSSCGFNKREKVEAELQESLSVYPTKNLEDFYDKEGYRDANFSKEDKGVWTIYTAIDKKNEQDELDSEGVILHINRNSRTSEGEYFVEKGMKDVRKDVKKRYPITVKNGKLRLKDSNVDPRIKEKVENFELFVQFGKLNDLKQYEFKNFSYNPELPNYLLMYNLNPNDSNLKEIEQRYNLKTKSAPELIFEGRGDVKSDVGGSNTVTYTLDDVDSCFLTSAVGYRPERYTK
ncbi:tandem-type lipoprotein [Staphylococcus ratti]|uniref:Tandem-type lipoprotein n=1 Tax=Staphylococcus ratti TaxID=2892440 RepID=A0ABY3PD68_9STAP|nr:tandem-type lipoprotein [Staphylococcus ratti]UEX90270.1 tandem-type lipoprotein [Staphylococcus ratti]